MNNIESQSRPFADHIVRII